MIVIKGWAQYPDFSIRCKCCEHIAAETVVSMIESAKTGPVAGYIRMPGGMVLGYNRYPGGRIVIKQI